MTWIRIDAGIGDHPKFRQVPKRYRYDLIGWFVCLVGWSAANLTDGQIPAAVLRDSTGRYCARAALAQRYRMIHTAPGQCATCAPPQDPGGCVIHDYREYQPLKAEVTASRDALRERVSAHRARRRNAVTEALPSEVGQVSVTPPTSPKYKHLLTLVSSLTYQQSKINKTTTPENLTVTWARWREIAGPAVDLAVEADAWLDRCYTAGMPDDPAGAWLGWLRTARARADAAEALADDAAARRPPGCAACSGGWLGEDDAGRPIPCSTCRPNVIRIRSGIDHA